MELEKVKELQILVKEAIEKELSKEIINDSNNNFDRWWYSWN